MTSRQGQVSSASRRCKTGAEWHTHWLSVVSRGFSLERSKGASPVRQADDRCELIRVGSCPGGRGAVGSSAWWPASIW